jgi:hypothetical protein
MTLPISRIQGAGNPGLCEWCKKDADELRPTYDWEECGGFDPAIYWVCLECAGKEGKSFDEAMAELAAYWGDSVDGAQ